MWPLQTIPRVTFWLYHLPLSSLISPSHTPMLRTTFIALKKRKNTAFIFLKHSFLFVLFIWKLLGLEDQMTEGGLWKTYLQILNPLPQCCQRWRFLIWLMISKHRLSDCKSGSAEGDGVCSLHKTNLIKSMSSQLNSMLNYGLYMNLIWSDTIDKLFTWYSFLKEKIQSTVNFEFSCWIRSLWKLKQQHPTPKKSGSRLSLIGCNHTRATSRCALHIVQRTAAAGPDAFCYLWKSSCCSVDSQSPASESVLITQNIHPLVKLQGREQDFSGKWVAQFQLLHTSVIIAMQINPKPKHCHPEPET